MNICKRRFQIESRLPERQMDHRSYSSPTQLLRKTFVFSYRLCTRTWRAIYVPAETSEFKRQWRRRISRFHEFLRDITRAIDLPSVGLFRRKQAVYEPDFMLAEVWLVGPHCKELPTSLQSRKVLLLGKGVRT